MSRQNKISLSNPGHHVFVTPPRCDVVSTNVPKPTVLMKPGEDFFFFFPHDTLLESRILSPAEKCHIAWED